MEFIKLIVELPNINRVLILLGIFIINGIFALCVSKNILSVYYKTGSAENAMTRFRILSQYIYTIILLISVFFVSLMIVPFFKCFGVFSKLLGPMITAGVTIILLTIVQIIYFKPIKMIRGISANIFENLGIVLKWTIFMLIPIIIINIMFQLMPKNDNFIILQTIFLITVIVGIILIMPLFYKRMLKAEPLKDIDLRNAIEIFVGNNGLKNVNIYQWPSIKNKTANAFASGFHRKSIYISDYLVENFSYEEIISIVAHEIGHIKNNHLWIRLFIAIVPVPVFTEIGMCMEYYENIYHTEIPVIPGMIFLVTLFLLYIVGFKLLITRIQERQADLYTLDIGIEANVFVSALLKLAELNHMTKKMNKIDVKFQTHPDIARRIKWIEENIR